MPGVRAELAVHGPSNCPVAALSADHDGPVTDVTWTDADGTFTEQFRVAPGAPTPEEATPVVDAGDERVYQYSRPSEADCACRVVESLGAPVDDVRAADGALIVTLHLEGVERLRGLLADLEAVAEAVEVRYLVHAPPGADEGDRTLVDRGKLTDRQREVLATAYRMGYFEHPREANATAVAEALDISLSTLAEHLSAAQRKLLEDVLGEA